MSDSTRRCVMLFVSARRLDHRTGTPQPDTLIGHVIIGYLEYTLFPSIDWLRSELSDSGGCGGCSARGTVAKEGRCADRRDGNHSVVYIIYIFGFVLAALKMF